MTTQLDFKFSTQPAPDPEEIECFVEWLHLRPGFHPAKEISRLTGTDDRKVRQLAEHAAGRVVSGPGSPGYCHAAHCPPETLRRVVAALESQARNMMARARRIRDAGHRYIQHA